MDNKKITNEDVERMCQLYDELGTYKAVAEKMKISASSVSKYIQMRGVSQNIRLAVDNLINIK